MAMMKKWTVLATTALCSAALVTGCTPGHNTTGSTLVGAGAGGLLGAVLFHGSGAWIGVAAGALVGAVLGNQVGKYMDRQDKLNMQHAISSVPVGEEATWTNDKDVTYSVRPIKQYHKNHHYCREYQTRVKINGKWRSAYGKACRKPDGSWKIVS